MCIFVLNKVIAWLGKQLFSNLHIVRSKCCMQDSASSMHGVFVKPKHVLHPKVPGNTPPELLNEVKFRQYTRTQLTTPWASCLQGRPTGGTDSIRDSREARAGACAH